MRDKNNRDGKSSNEERAYAREGRRTMPLRGQAGTKGVTNNCDQNCDKTARDIT